MSLGLAIFMSFLSNVGIWLALGGFAYAARTTITRLLGSLTNSKYSKNYNNKINQDLLLLSLASGFGIMVLLTFIGVNAVFTILASIGVGLWIPKHVESVRHHRFIRDFDHALIEGLTTVGSSLKAGLTLKDSLTVAAKNTQGAFSSEVELALKEYRFGMPLDKALDEIRIRVGSANANIAFGAMIIGNQLGGNLPDTLNKIVQTIRDRERVEGKLRSLTAQGRTQAWLLCSAPPVIGFLMYLWDPQKMALLTGTLHGQIMLISAIILEVTGIAVTRKVMQLDV